MDNQEKYDLLGLGIDALEALMVHTEDDNDVYRYKNIQVSLGGDLETTKIKLGHGRWSPAEGHRITNRLVAIGCWSVANRTGLTNRTVEDAYARLTRPASLRQLRRIVGSAIEKITGNEPESRCVHDLGTFHVRFSTTALSKVTLIDSRETPLLYSPYLWILAEIGADPELDADQARDLLDRFDGKLVQPQTVTDFDRAKQALDQIFTTKRYDSSVNANVYKANGLEVRIREDIGSSTYTLGVGLYHHWTALEDSDLLGLLLDLNGGDDEIDFWYGVNRLRDSKPNEDSSTPVKDETRELTEEALLALGCSQQGDGIFYKASWTASIIVRDNQDESVIVEGLAAFPKPLMDTVHGTALPRLGAGLRELLDVDKSNAEVKEAYEAICTLIKFTGK